MASGPDFLNDDLHEGGADPIDLTACDREPIHIPGSIQPHGLLLVASRVGWTVIGGAGAVEDRLTPTWLGRGLSMLLAQRIDAAVAQAEANPGTVVPLAAVPGRREAFDALLHVSGEHIVVELEPQPDTQTGAAVILARLDAMGAGLERAPDLQALCDQAAIDFRELTGFDRVMIYRFQGDAGGVVVAEDRDAAIPSFLNHHFPATDIPRQARQLYVRNRVRIIPDCTYEPAPMRSLKADLAAIDLSDATLRSVSPVHLRYLQNMGVTASASVSIVLDGQLWGLVACHHRTAREMSYETRTACRVLAGALARQIRSKAEAETYRDRIRLRQAEDALLSRFDTEASFERIFEAMAEELRLMFDADGFVAVRDGRVDVAGLVPDSRQIGELARWLTPRTMIEPLATAMLSERFPPAVDYQEIASGLLAVNLTTDAPTLLMWFRAEEPLTVEWAGNPHKKASADPGAILTPRTSFEAWRETLRGHARRWTMSEVQAANRLRRGLFDLRQRQRLRELNRTLAAAVAEKEKLIGEKDHLLRDVNHRVQNSLQLVQSFLALQARDALPDVAGHLVEAQRRLSAVALVHARLNYGAGDETIDLALYLGALMDDLRDAMGGEWRGAITSHFVSNPASADRAISVGLIVTELVINAQKYGYGGRPGPVAIALEQHRRTLRLIVADQGGGVQRDRAEPANGFGTRMVAAMVDRLGATIKRQDNRPGLRVVVTIPLEE